MSKKRENNLVCRHCGKAFSVPPSMLKRGGGKHCSPACQYAARKAAPKPYRYETLDATSVRVLLAYDPSTGIFRWRPRPGDALFNAQYANTIAGVNQTKLGLTYRRIKISGKCHFAHRLAWLYVHGKWPAVVIDHINSDTLDNRICNLREATYRENACHRRMQKRTISGFKGAHYKHDLRLKWKATIFRDGKHHDLGSYATPEEAGEAYRKAAPKFHGEFAKS